MALGLEHTFHIAEARLTEYKSEHFMTQPDRTRANDAATKDSAIKESRRLPDKPWKYNPPAPTNASRPKPVVVPKGK